MTHAALFNGIGGFQLAAEWAGWRNILSVEIDEWCNQVTAHHYPECKQYQNIYDFDGTEWAGKVDVLTGGFPCQPFSATGKRKGTADDRHLWPEMLRVIGEIKPRWIIGENVLGFVNWSDGMVFDQVHIDLENQGYEVQSFILPACSVNAPHSRDRVWIVAKDTMRSRRIHGESKQERSEDGELRDRSTRNTDRICGEEVAGIASDAKGSRSSVSKLGKEEAGFKIQARSNIDGYDGLESTTKSRNINRRYEQSSWKSFPTQSSICFRDDGIPSRMDQRAFSKWRTNSLKAAGNAIVPQVAYQLMKVINQMEAM